MNPGLNGIGSGLMGPNRGRVLHQTGTRLLIEGLEARLRASEFDFHDEIGKPTFKPDVEHSSFNPFNNDEFDAFHLSGLNHSNAADWFSDDALSDLNHSNATDLSDDPLGDHIAQFASRNV